MTGPTRPTPCAERSPRHRLAALALACVVAVPVLSGCAAAVIGGAAVGTLVALDRRTSGIQLEDEGIELRAGARLRDALGEPAHVNVTSYNRQVLLSGEVPTDQARQQAEQIAQRVENVRSVVNDLAVMPKSTLAQRSNDALITGKVKASLVDAKDLSAAAVKVVTERGVVYLMGRVTEREVKRATEIASRVSGVKKVVRVFEVISEEELRRITAAQPAPARAPAASPAAAPVSTATPTPAPSAAPAR